MKLLSKMNKYKMKFCFVFEYVSGFYFIWFFFLMCRNGTVASQKPHSCFHQRSGKTHFQMHVSFYKSEITS
jgi:hypothetical protein